MPSFSAFQTDAALAFGLIAAVDRRIHRNRRRRPDAELRNWDFR